MKGWNGSVGIKFKATGTPSRELDFYYRDKNVYIIVVRDSCLFPLLPGNNRIKMNNTKVVGFLHLTHIRN